MPQESATARVQPVLRSNRLVLRPFRLEDAPGVRDLAGDPSVADTALDIPHPFEDGMAEGWISTHEAAFAAGELAAFAVTAADSGELLGAAGLMIDPAHARGELGYWIGRAYWGRGYATEAARTLVAFGFGPLGLRRIHASHLARNPASGRVLARLGMRPEGVLQEHVVHRGRAEDLVVYGLLAADGDRSPDVPANGREDA